jgi:hypothetical protein
MAFETELTGALLQPRYFSIDEESVIYKDTQMLCADITGFAYGGVQTSVNGIKSKQEYHLRFIDSSGDDISFNFTSAFNMDLRAEDVYEQIVAEIWAAFGNRIYQDTIKTIVSGGVVKLRDVEFSKAGAAIQHKPFFGKKRCVLIPWDEMDVELDGGMLTLRDGRDSAVRDIFSLGGTFNTRIILRLFEQMGSDSNFISHLQGK